MTELLPPGVAAMIGYVIGPYRITGKIGEGGMGTVFTGVDTMLDREVAIKMLRPEFSRQSPVVERFRSEAIILAKLSHPNVGILHAFLREGDEYFMVMEFVHGETLDAMIRRTGRLTPGEATRICLQALDGIEHAHEHGVIHRDIKPANIMLTPKGLVKVMDFGISRLVGTSRMTATGTLMGTIEYMSPEQIEGRDVDGRSDIYSLGISLYEMVTGCVPFKHTSEYGLMKKQIEEPPAPPRDFVPDIPPGLEDVILRALVKQPAGRFQSTAEFREALVRAGTQPVVSYVNTVALSLPGEPIKETRVAGDYVSPSSSETARSESLASSAPAAKTRNRWIPASIVIVLAVVLAGLALVLVKQRSRNHEARAEVSSPEVKAKPAETQTQPQPAQPATKETPPVKPDVPSPKVDNKNTSPEPTPQRPVTPPGPDSTEAFKPAQPPAQSMDTFSGLYSGSCTNLTVQKSARLDMHLQKDVSGKLSGSVTIMGGLSGSGPIMGQTDGRSIHFTSFERKSGMTIKWSGTIEGNTIRGVYTVEPLPQLGISDEQKGVWRVIM